MNHGEILGACTFCNYCGFNGKLCNTNKFKDCKKRIREEDNDSKKIN